MPKCDNGNVANKYSIKKIYYTYIELRKKMLRDINAVNYICICALFR